MSEEPGQGGCDNMECQQALLLSRRDENDCRVHLYAGLAFLSLIAGGVVFTIVIAASDPVRIIITIFFIIEVVGGTGLICIMCVSSLIHHRSVKAQLKDTHERIQQAGPTT